MRKLIKGSASHSTRRRGPEVSLSFAHCTHAAIAVMAVALAVEVGISTYLIIAAILVVAAILSWFAAGVWLRGLRIVNGALTAMLATFVTVAFSLTVSTGSTDGDPGFTMMVILLLGAAYSTWVCDWRIKAADDARAEARHKELMAAVQAAVAARRPRSGADFGLAALLLLLLRRRRL